MTVDEAVEQIVSILRTGIPALGFVSPSHVVNQMLEIIEGVHKRGYKPIIVYNTNAYDKVETLKKLENIVNVYLPDLKYMDNSLGKKYSKVSNYVEIATSAIKEMFRQKGDKVSFNKYGYATNGLIIRHLVLPNHIENSKEVLRFIAEELSPNVHISLMSQYHPAADAWQYPEIARPLHPEEYQEVVEFAKKLKLRNLWLQRMFSYDNFLVDFGD